MGVMQPSLSLEDLSRVVGTAACPRIVDVRRSEAFEAAAELIPGAVWRDHRDAETWGRALGDGGEIVVYCVHGHQVSQSAAALLRSQGLDARYLAGGIEAYREAGGTLIKKWPGLHDPAAGPSHWVVAAGTNLDSLARAWFIRRFLDPAASLHFAEADWVDDIAIELGGWSISPEVAGENEACRLNEFFLRYSLADAALQAVAEIVESAGQDRGIPRRHGVGLSEVIEGMTLVFAEDSARVQATLPVFDALYAGCRRRILDAPAGGTS